MREGFYINQSEYKSKWPWYQFASGNIVEMRFHKAQRKKANSSCAVAYWQREPSGDDLDKFDRIRRGMIRHLAGARFMFYNPNYKVGL